MERKNAIKFLKVWGIVTVALILAFRFLLTPLVNAVDIPVAIFDAAIIGGFVGWSIYTVVAIKAIYTVLKTNKSPTKTIKPTKTSKEDNSNSEYIKIDKKLFNTILIVLGVIVVFYIGYISAGNLNVSTQTINFNENEEYFEWVYKENGDIEPETYNYKGSPFTGVLEVYYENGQLYKKATYKDGIQDGPLEYYYENGQLHKKGSYDYDFEYDGPFEVYYENGQLQAKGAYKYGWYDGLYEEYYENGQLKEKATYKDGKEDGPFEDYHKNGQLWTKGAFKDGKEDGPFESYYANGQLSSKEAYKDGKRDGPYESYYYNGELWKKRTYKDGECISGDCSD